MWKKIKIRKEDEIFAKAIKIRDGWKCKFCGKYFPEGHRRGLDCAHFWGRKNESVRFNSDNADALCTAHHSYFHQYPSLYYDWKKEQLGEDGFNALQVRANTYCKKDRSMRILEVKEFLKMMEATIEK